MKIKIIFVILVSALVHTCEEGIGEQVYRFNIVNNTNDTLYFYRATTARNFIYPDTTLIESQPLNNVLPNSTFRLGGFSTPEEIFAELPNDTLSIYFFHPDTLATYSWNEIRSGYKVLKRYDISLADFRALNLEIPYPSTEEMQNIRQYPPFE